MRKKECKIPRLPYWALKKLFVFGYREGYAGDIEEEFHNIAKREGRRWAMCWIWYHAIAAIPGAINHFLFGEEACFKII